MAILTAETNTKAAALRAFKQAVEQWADIVAPILSTFCGEDEIHIRPADRAVYQDREDVWLSSCVGLAIEEKPRHWRENEGSRDWHQAEVDVAPILACAEEATVESVREATAEFRRRISFLQEDPYLCGQLRFPYFSERPGTVPGVVLDRATEKARQEKRASLDDTIAATRREYAACIRPTGHGLQDGLLGRAAESERKLQGLLDLRRSL